MTPAAHLAVGVVRAYQWTIRPLIGANCRFWPSCSDYAVEAVRAHGAARGSVLAAWRILRCNPWCEGGFDPVPPCRCVNADGARLAPASRSWPAVRRPTTPRMRTSRDGIDGPHAAGVRAGFPFDPWAGHHDEPALPANDTAHPPADACPDAGRHGQTRL